MYCNLIRGDPYYEHCNKFIKITKSLQESFPLFLDAKSHRSIKSVTWSQKKREVGIQLTRHVKNESKKESQYWEKVKIGSSKLKVDG